MLTKYEQQQPNKQVKLISHKDIEGILAEEFGPAFREHRERWRRVMNMEEVPDFPMTIEMENNNYCNLRCHMCVFAVKGMHPDHKNGMQKRNMPFDTFTRAIDEGADHGLRACTYGVLCEPLLHPEILKMVDYAAKKGLFDQRLGSNGLLLTEDVSRSLIESRLPRLEISMEAATEETYNKIRKGSNFKKVLSNIHNFLKLRDKLGSRLPLLRVSFLRTNINDHELDAFLDYWEDYADYFSIQHPIDYELEIEDSLLDFGVPKDRKGFRCEKTFQRVFMRHDGSIMACGHIHGYKPFRLGNVNEQTIKSMWDSELMEELRGLHRNGEYYKNKICYNCVKHTSTEE